MQKKIQQYTHTNKQNVNKQMQKVQQYIQTQNPRNVWNTTKGKFSHTTNAKMQQYTHNEYKNATTRTQINKNATVRIIKKKRQINIYI